MRRRRQRFQHGTDIGRQSAQRFEFDFVCLKFIAGWQLAVNQQMRHFFKFALLGEIENIVAAIVEIVTAFTDSAQRGVARRDAGQRDGFLRFNDMGIILQDRGIAHVVLVIIIMCRVLRVFVQAC